MEGMASCENCGDDVSLDLDGEYTCGCWRPDCDEDHGSEGHFGCGHQAMHRSRPMIRRSLTVKQPYAWAICYAGKDVENRTWPVPKTVELPFRLMIHAGASRRMDSIGWPQGHPVHPPGIDILDNIKVWTRERETVVGDRSTAELVDGALVHATHAHPYGSKLYDNEGALAQPFSAVVAVATVTGCHEPSHRQCSSPWAIEGMFHWELSDVQRLTEPITDVKGRQGLWIPDADLIARVEAAEKVAA